MNCGREFRVEMTKNGRGHEQRFELIEGGFHFGRPDERLTFAQQAGDRKDDTGISFDETTVEIGESQKYLDVEDGFGNGPFSDSANAFGVH